MTRGIELRRPWGARTSTLHCTHGHATKVPTANAPATCPVCDAAQAAPLDLVAVLTAHIHTAHPYADDCDCAPCTDCRAILDARVDAALDADLDDELFAVTTDAPRVLYTLPHTATPTHRPDCATPHLRYGWCDCTVASRVS